MSLIFRTLVAASALRASISGSTVVDNITGLASRELFEISLLLRRQKNNHVGLPYRGGSLTTPQTSSRPAVAALFYHPNKQARKNEAKLISLDGKSQANRVLSSSVQNKAAAFLGRLTHLRATFFTIAFISSIILSPCNHILHGAIALIYIWECYACSTRRYLSNMITATDLENMLRHLRSSPPIITWNIESYHYRTSYSRERHERIMFDEGDRIVTHRSSRSYNYGSWKDETHFSDLRLMDGGAPATSYVKVTFSILSRFKNGKSLHEYKSQKAHFIGFERWRDHYIDEYTSLHVDEYLPKLLIKITDKVGPQSSHFAKARYFWILSLLGLTVPFRIWFARQCTSLSFTIEKEVAAA